MNLIKTCFELIRFVDYIHDRKKYVPLAKQMAQPPRYIIDAHLFKMKADLMKIIFECLDGSDGLLEKVTIGKLKIEENF